jgi:2-haloacid dehalogenase
MLDFKNFEVLTFDCYGTLIDWETGIIESLRPALDRAGVAFEAESVLEAYGALEAGIEAGGYRLYKDVLRAVYAGLGERFGFAPAADEILDFSTSVGNWPAFPDSLEALATLQGKFKLGILSNIDRDQFAHSAQKLRTDFDYVFTAEDIRSYKPSPRNFEYALEQLPVAPDRVLHVAQSLYHDIGPARKLGLSTVWINRRHGAKGTGATPRADARAHAEYPDLRSFAEAACDQRGF